MGCRVRSWQVLMHLSIERLAHRNDTLRIYQNISVHDQENHTQISHTLLIKVEPLTLYP